MLYSFAQIRYNNNDTDMSNTTDENMISGAAFTAYGTIYQLGIQAPPGTIFYIDGDNQMMVGNSGIFELDLMNKAYISDLRFSEKSINFVKENKSSFIIVDIVYGGSEGE